MLCFSLKNLCLLVMEQSNLRRSAQELEGLFEDREGLRCAPGDTARRRQACPGRVLHVELRARCPPRSGHAGAGPTRVPQRWRQCHVSAPAPAPSSPVPLLTRTTPTSRRALQPGRHGSTRRNKKQLSLLGGWVRVGAAAPLQEAGRAGRRGNQRRHSPPLIAPDTASTRQEAGRSRALPRPPRPAAGPWHWFASSRILWKQNPTLGTQANQQETQIPVM